jgi:hypothetical protein
VLDGAAEPNRLVAESLRGLALLQQPIELDEKTRSPPRAPA